METLWFCLTAFLITGYVVLDGFDLGAGMVHLLVARTEAEKRAVMETIAPVWDGNEVWLVAGGGTLFFAFPVLYASSFSGFYLPLMIVLWLLMLRGCSIEFRNHLQSPTWTPVWDVAFAGSSALLAVFFGAALGNVVRGVSFERPGEFFLPLWTDFGAGAPAGILDWYTILVGLLAAVALLAHGALWVAWRTDGVLTERAAKVARKSWPAVAGLTAAVTAATGIVQPVVGAGFRARPWLAVFPLLALAGLVTAWRGGPARRAFGGSTLYLAGMLASVAAGLYPHVLPALGTPGTGLTIYNSAAPAYGLGVGLGWWIPGMFLALGYNVSVYRQLRLR